MENLELTVKYLETLEGKNEEAVLAALKGIKDLGRDQKNLIYVYLFRNSRIFEYKKDYAVYLELQFPFLFFVLLFVLLIFSC